jgi:hypothetical protein
MSTADEQPCLSGPEILLEQFIPDHVFLYVTKGTVTGFDGSKNYTLRAGDYCLVRKNRLAKYNSEKVIRNLKGSSFVLKKSLSGTFRENTN